MSLGTLESIAQSLETIAAQLGNIDTIVNAQKAGAATNSKTSNTSDEPAEPVKKATAKKAASKKTASKKTASKKAKGQDYSDMTDFKKALFEIAETSGVDDVMPKLKAYIASCNYGASDEIEVEDRVQFLKDVKEHFAELAGESAEPATELDDF